MSPQQTIENPPSGWRWFRDAISGGRLFSTYNASGCPTAYVVAYAVDPLDHELEKTGDFQAAVHRGTAKEYRFSAMVRHPWEIEAALPPDGQPIPAAVLAERERCAKIADAIADDPHGSNPSCSTAEMIAAEIREGR